MASMWRRAMVYLGLQDDDELDYGGEYETYGDYGDPAEEPQAARPRREAGGEAPDGRVSRDSGTVRTRPSETEYATDYGAELRRTRRTGPGARTGAASGCRTA